MPPYRFVKPVDISSWTSEEIIESSLKRLCARKLLSSGALSPSVCIGLPQVLRNYLIHCAMTRNHSSSVTAILNLLNGWRTEVFVFEVSVYLKRWEPFVMPHVYANSQIFWNEHTHVQLVIERVLYALVSNSLSQCRIRCLDLTYFPVDSLFLRRIHRVIDEFGIPPHHGDVSAVKRRKLSEEHNTTEKFVIKMNCVTHVKEDISLLCRTLSHLIASNPGLHIQVKGVHITNTSTPCKSVLQLLDILEPEMLNSFSCCLSFCHDREQYNCDLIQKLRNFPNINSLNFQLDCCKSGYHQRLFFELNDVCCELKNLKHFALYHLEFRHPFHTYESRLDRRVPLVLSFVGQLECLLLTSCNVSTELLRHFSESSEVLPLKTLSLSRSKADLQSVLLLLNTCKYLKNLNLEKTILSGGDIDLLFEALPNLKKLEYLDIRGMNMGPDELLSKTKHISRLPSLKYLLVSAGSDSADIIGDDSGFQKKFYNALEMLWNYPRKNPLNRGRVKCLPKAELTKWMEG